MAQTPRHFMPEQFRTYVRHQNTQALQLRASFAQDKEHLRNTHPPSFFAYSTVFIAAAILDILDVVAPVVDATIIGFFIVVAINIIFFLVLRAFLNKSVHHQQLLGGLLLLGAIVFFIPIIGQLFAAAILLVLIVEGARNKSAVVIDTSRDNIVSHLARLEEAVSASRARLASAIRTARKVPGLRRPARAVSRIARPITRASGVAKRILRNTVGNIVPFIGIFFLQVWTVIGTYRDQKKIFAESQALLQECLVSESQEQVARKQHQQELAVVIAVQEQQAQQEARQHTQIQAQSLATI